MPPEQREAHERIYGVERGAVAGTGPMVVSVNGVVASLAVTEFTVFATGMPAPAAQIICRGETPVVRRVVDEPAKARATCDHDAVDPCRLRLATARR
jgi:hypothetical protein